MSNSDVESVTSDRSLTEPTLNSIYDSKDLLDENNANNDVYNDLNEGIAKLTSNTERAIQQQKQENNSRYSLFSPAAAVPAIFKLAILGITGILFAKLSEQIHDNNLQLTAKVVYRPIELSAKLIRAVFFKSQLFKNSSSIDILDQYSSLIGFVWGIVLGLTQPVLDLLFPAAYNQRLFRFTTVRSSGIDFSAIVRATIVLLGISFGLRKVDWESSLQASIALAALNPCVWLLLDSTISGLVGGWAIAAVATSSVIVFDEANNINHLHNFFDFSGKNYDNLAVCLFTSSFFFCSLIIYGNLGRFLFKD